MALDVEVFYQKYGPMVYRRCFKILKNEEEALDITQDVFVSLLKNQNRLNQSAPSSLLYTIATNLSLNRIKKNKKASFSGDVEPLIAGIADLDDHAKLTETGIFLDQFFSKEKPNTRTIAYLHYVDGMTLEETAKTVGMSVSGIRKRLRKIKEEGAKWLQN